LAVACYILLIFPINRGRVERKEREGREGQSHIEGRREWNGGRKPEALS